jgi:hypothetical protein
MSCLICNELLHHMCEPCNKFKPSSPSWHVLLTHMYLWTNYLCISLQTQLVHLRLSLNYQNQTRTFQALALDTVGPLVALRVLLLELLFAAPAGRAQHPSQSLLRSTAQSSLHASIETTTKPSRRWQPSRVASTTGLQLET